MFTRHNDKEKKMDSKVTLQSYERRGKFGVLFYGAEDSVPSTWEKKIVNYHKPVVRTRKEIVEEQKRLLKLDVYEDDSNSNIVFH